MIFTDQNRMGTGPSEYENSTERESAKAGDEVHKQDSQCMSTLTKRLCVLQGQEEALWTRIIVNTH